jgi:hypothetical protein
MNRYKELKYQDKIYTETAKIEEILIKCKFDWFLDCEVENVRLEITKNTLVFNAGVFRDGQWKYGTWEGGVWYNGTWYNGIFKNGIIFGGRFIGGKIEGGEIRGGEIFDVDLSKEVVDTTLQKVIPQTQNQPQGIPNNRGMEQKIQGQSPEEEPQVQKVQPQKIEERVIKNYTTFINEGRLFKSDPPKEDDEIAEKVLKYLQNHDVQIGKRQWRFNKYLGKVGPRGR